MTLETTVLFLERELIKLTEALDDFTSQTEIRIKSINEIITILKKEHISKEYPRFVSFDKIYASGFKWCSRCQKKFLKLIKDVRHVIKN